MSEDVIEYQACTTTINNEVCFGFVTTCNGKQSFFEAVNRHGQAVHVKIDRFSAPKSFSYPKNHDVTKETKERINRFMKQTCQQIPEPFRRILQPG
jgi:hypothetical protein